MHLEDYGFPLKESKLMDGDRGEFSAGIDYSGFLNKGHSVEFHVKVINQFPNI